MTYRAAQLASIAALAALAGCNGGSAASPPASAPVQVTSDAGADAATVPPSAYSECNPAGPHDAATFLFTATCAPVASDGAAPASCAEWAEGADGDWTPFAESCILEGGALTTVPCPEAGLQGTCTLPATCTTQTTLFFYGPAPASSASDEAACAASGGTFAP